MRNLIDIVEGHQIDASVIRTILDHPRLKHGAKIPKSARFWRGEEEGEEGSGFATYGTGFYFTCDKSYAARYGDVSEVSGTMLPDNPLRFDTTNDFQIWKQDAMKALGYSDARDFSRDYDDIRTFVQMLDPTIDGIQMFTGRDSVFVTYP